MKLVKMYMLIFTIITSVIGTTNRLANTSWDVYWNNGDFLSNKIIDYDGRLFPGDQTKNQTKAMPKKLADYDGKTITVTYGKPSLRNRAKTSLIKDDVGHYENEGNTIVWHNSWWKHTTWKRVVSPDSPAPEHDQRTNIFQKSESDEISYTDSTCSTRTNDSKDIDSTPISIGTNDIEDTKMTVQKDRIDENKFDNYDPYATIEQEHVKNVLNEFYNQEIDNVEKKTVHPSKNLLRAKKEETGNDSEDVEQDFVMIMLNITFWLVLFLISLQLVAINDVLNKIYNCTRNKLFTVIN